MIEVRELSKLYGDFRAVDSLSFDVPAGEVLGLVGPNGAGKTTTLRCLAGIIPPSGGRIRIGGHDIKDDPVEAKRLVSFIPDEPKLFEYLTVEEHLRFVCRLYGVDGMKSAAATLLEELELTGREKALPLELSRGMKQKLSIACGLIHDPRVIIFDEPLTGLDPAGIRRMKQTIAARAAAGCAILISSHLLSLVEEICHRVLILDGGKKIVHGTLEEISKDASLEEIFFKVTKTS
ncbi:MAG TPA: ABC transporter ATP-binding protein [Verrucomicrobiae bacterium]|nr:ABC transporter ATP-binding protein [Verrucomicrobiae bacterium]